MVDREAFAEIRRLDAEIARLTEELRQERFRHSLAEREVSELRTEVKHLRDRHLMTPSEREGILGEDATTSNQPEADMHEAVVEHVIGDLTDVAGMSWWAQQGHSIGIPAETVLELAARAQDSLRRYGRLLSAGSLSPQHEAIVAEARERRESERTRLRVEVARLRPPAAWWVASDGSDDWVWADDQDHPGQPHALHMLRPGHPLDDWLRTVIPTRTDTQEADL